MEEKDQNVTTKAKKVLEVFKRKAVAVIIAR